MRTPLLSSLFASIVASTSLHAVDGYTVEPWSDPGGGEPAAWTSAGPLHFVTNNAAVPTALMLDGLKGDEQGVRAEIDISFLADDDFAGLIFGDRTSASGERRLLLLSLTNGGDARTENDVFALYDVTVAADAEPFAIGTWLTKLQRTVASDPPPTQGGVAADRLWRMHGAGCTYMHDTRYRIELDVKNVDDPIDGEIGHVSMGITVAGRHLASMRATTQPIAPGRVGAYTFSQQVSVKFVSLGPAK